MLRFIKVQHVGVSPNKRASLYRATHSKMFFVLVPQTVLIELILEEPCSKKLFIPILVTFKERLNKSEHLPGIERDRLSSIKNSFVLRQIDPVKGVILTNKEITKFTCMLRHDPTFQGF